MTVQDMFHAIYHAAWTRHIPASALDPSPPYVVGWMIQEPAQAESDTDLIDLAMERARRRNGG